MAISTSTLYGQNLLRDDYFRYEQELRMREDYLMKEAQLRAKQEACYVAESTKQKPVKPSINKTILLLGD